MEENKNSEEILNEENQADKGLNEEIISDDNYAADNSSSVENEYSPILDDDADTAYSEETAVANKSNLSIKILIPVIIVLAALIVTAVILAVNKSNKNDMSNSGTALASSDGEVTPNNSAADSSSSNAKVPEPSFKINGKKVDTDDLVFLKIDGIEIGFDELRNCYYQFIYNYGPYYGISEEGFENASGEELTTMFNSFKESLAEYIKGGYVHAIYAKNNNIDFDGKDKKEVKKRIQSIKNEQGDNYKSYLKQNYMTEKYLNIAMKNNVIANKVIETLSVPKKDFYNKAQKELYQVKQIFIPFGSEEKISDDVLSSNSVEDYDKLSKPDKASIILSNYDSLSDDKKTKAQKESKQVADDIYKQIQSGANFDSLMKNNTYDSLYEKYPKGILVGKDYEYDESFLKASLDLKENEISKVIKSSSGYHIIMRVPLDKKYINENVSYFAQTYNDNTINKILYKVYDKIKVEQTDTYKNFNYGDLT